MAKALWQMNDREAVRYWAAYWERMSGRTDEDGQAALAEIELALTELGAIRTSKSWKPAPIDRTKFIPGVRAHALLHYEEGWDVVVEAMSDEELVAEMGYAESVDGAIRKVGEMVRIRHEVFCDIRATAF